MKYLQSQNVGIGRTTPGFPLNEERNSKENYFKFMPESANTSLKPETFNFKEINQKQPLCGTKNYAEISTNEAVLYYGAVQKP